MPDAIFQFFGLRENPFKINPDPRFLFATDQSHAAAEELAYGIRSRKGLILLTGEVGTGKTMLIRHLLDWLAEQRMPTALIVNSHIKSDHLIDFILNDFGVPCTSTFKSEKLLALNAWLLQRYRAGQTPVLIVDEAQGLEPTTLEEIRLLLNLETPSEKLLQIVLAGQPELEIKLKRHELRQLCQRIAIRCRTAALTLEQTHGYINQRLSVAGANGNPLFQPGAVAYVHAYSRGIPRVVNVLCEHSLINACADGVHTISPGAVERAARECELDRAESVARILNAGSYSTTSLSDIDSVLASVSASGPAPAANPKSIAQPPPSAQISTPTLGRSQHTPRALVAAEFGSATIPPDRGEPNAIPNEVMISPAQAGPVEATSPLQTPTVEESVPMPRVSPARSLPLYYLRYWGRSIAADARRSASHFRRAIQSFEVRAWKPFIRDVRRELHKASAQASHFLADPRWKHLRSRTVSSSQAYWRAFKATTLPWLTKLSIDRRQLQERARGTHAPRINRPRAIASLRKWLHKPLTSQRKRMEGNQRRSIN